MQRYCPKSNFPCTVPFYCTKTSMILQRVLFDTITKDERERGR